MKDKLWKMRPRRTVLVSMLTSFTQVLTGKPRVYATLQISDVIRGTSNTDADHQVSMEYALLITTFICILGGFCFIMCSFNLQSDREQATQLTRANTDVTSLLNSVASRNHGTVGADNRALIGEGSDGSDDDEPPSEDISVLVATVAGDNLRERRSSNPVV